MKDKTFYSKSQKTGAILIVFSERQIAEWEWKWIMWHISKHEANKFISRLPSTNLGIKQGNVWRTYQHVLNRSISILDLEYAWELTANKPQKDLRDYSLSVLIQYNSTFTFTTLLILSHTSSFIKSWIYDNCMNSLVHRRIKFTSIPEIHIFVTIKVQMNSKLSLQHDISSLLRKFIQL